MYCFFGTNGKISPNITTVFKDKVFVSLLSQQYTTLDRTNNIGEQTVFNEIISVI